MQHITEFETAIKQWYGAPFAIATDCCTHAIELCLRLTQPSAVLCPSHTYLSVPMTLHKLNIPYGFVDTKWEDYYQLGGTNIIDAAVYWKQNGYIPNTMMCLSFQFKKHLNTGRGGMILLDHEEQYKILKAMRYDGRSDDQPWAEQNVSTIGYHYYMTPETAALGLSRIEEAKIKKPIQWTWKNYPNLRTMDVFKNVQ